VHARAHVLIVASLPHNYPNPNPESPAGGKPRTCWFNGENCAQLRTAGLCHPGPEPMADWTNLGRYSTSFSCLNQMGEIAVLQVHGGEGGGRGRS